MKIEGKIFIKMAMLSFIILCSLHHVHSEFVWNITPKESIALAGDNVTITCTFSTNNQSDPEERFWWLRPDHNFRFVRNEAVLLGSLLRDRYIVHLDKKAGHYTLTITNVQHLDGGQFRCSHRQGRYDVTVTSEIATLIVLSPPPEGYPRCEYYSKSNLILSPSLTKALICPKTASWQHLNKVMNGNTFRGLYYHWDNLEGFFLQNGTTILSQTSQVDNTDVSFCMTEQTILRLFPTECTLVPEVDINMISVFIQPAGVHLRVGENMTFTCNVRGALKASKYEWAFPSSLQSTSLQISHQGSTATLTNIKEPGKKSGNEFTIVCQVTLESGRHRVALTNITIIKKDEGHIIDKQGKSPDIIKTLRELNKPRVIKNPTNGDTPPSQPAGNSSVMMDFLMDPDKLAIVLGPSLAVIVFFVCLSLALRCRRRKKTIVEAPPQIIVPLMEAKPDKRVKKFNPNTHLDIPAFSRSYSDATAYRFSRNFDVHNTFQVAQNSAARNSQDHRQQDGSRTQQSMNGCQSMPSLDFKSNTLPTKSKRTQELPLPPNSFMDLPHQCTSSASQLEPRGMEWKHKRSVHFASAPPKQMKKVKK